MSQNRRQPTTRRSLRQLLGERAATDPILVIAAIAVSLVLLVGGSFAVAGIIANGQDLNARNDLQLIATAETTAHATGGTYVDYARAFDGTETGDDADPERPGIQLLSQLQVGFTLSEATAALVQGCDIGWIAGTKSQTGKVYLRSSEDSADYRAPGETMPLPGCFTADDLQALIAALGGDTGGHAAPGGGGEVTPPAAAGLIAAGQYTSCTILDGQAWCWGSGFRGALGNGSGLDSPTPVAVDTSGALAGKTVTKITVGGGFACALADGAAYCWGDGTSGRLGNGANSASNVPVAVDTSGALAGKTVTDISAGSSTVCAIADGQAYCWGSRASGAAGDGAGSGSTPVPVAVNTSGALAGKTVTHISVGNNTTCAVANGAAYCWGYGSSGNLGDGNSLTSTTPVAVNTSGALAGKTVTRVATGSGHACAIADGQAYCWGQGSAGRLGSGGTTNSATPVAVDTSGALAGKTVTQISASNRGACVIADSRTYCWGMNVLEGILGPGSFADSLVPAAVGGDLATQNTTSVSTGGEHTCAIAESKVYCWGNNGTGQLGNGTVTSATTLIPSLVAMPG